MEITKEQRAELYSMQCEAMKPEFDGSSAFCPRGFVCSRCQKDLLHDLRTLEQAKKGRLITGCPFCCTSYVD